MRRYCRPPHGDIVDFVYTYGKCLRRLSTHFGRGKTLSRQTQKNSSWRAAVIIKNKNLVMHQTQLAPHKNNSLVQHRFCRRRNLPRSQQRTGRTDSVHRGQTIFTILGEKPPGEPLSRNTGNRHGKRGCENVQGCNRDEVPSRVDAGTLNSPPPSAALVEGGINHHQRS